VEVEVVVIAYYHLVVYFLLHTLAAGEDEVRGDPGIANT
jgi:hypothetical protein